MTHYGGAQRPCLTLALMVVMAVSAFGHAAAQEAVNPELFTDLGVPVKRNAIYNHILGTDAEGNERYYQAYKGEPWFLLSIDPLTGEAEQHAAEAIGNPYGICRAGDGRLYLSTGGSGIGEVYRFDPAARSLELVAQAPEGETAVWQLCEAEDGMIYGGPPVTTSTATRAQAAPACGPTTFPPASASRSFPSGCAANSRGAPPRDAPTASSTSAPVTRCSASRAPS